MRRPYSPSLLLLAIGILGLTALPQLGATLPTNPNILFIVVDDLNDFGGAFGGHPQAITPNMDALAAAGVRFGNAHTNAPVCGPSRSSFMTGVYPHNSGVFGFETWYNDPVLMHCKTLHEYVQEHGYSAFGTGKIMHNLDTGVGNTYPRWTEWSGYNAWLGPHAWDGSAAAPHPSVPLEYSSVAGYSIDGLFASLADIPTVGGHTGWRKTSWLSDYNYVDDNNRDLLADEESRDWVIQKISDLQAMDPTGQNEKFLMAVGFSRPHTPLVAPQRISICIRWPAYSCRTSSPGTRTTPT